MTETNGTRPRLDQDVILPFEDPGSDRRSFLRLMGFGFAAGTLAGCSRGPREEAIPWLAVPEDVVAGRAYRIATTCGACPSACGVLATCKDGRPVKLEGNPAQPTGRGALCATGQASILELYDSQRHAGPSRSGVRASWDEADAAIGAALAAAARDGGRVRLLTGTVNGPSTLSAVRRFLAQFKDARHVVYDPLSVAAILDAHAATHGVRALPRCRFERADVIAAFDCDFLGTWYSPVEHAAGWAEGRRADAAPPRHSRHWHFEPRMTVTGSAADERRRLAPHEIAPAILHLADLVEGRSPAAGEVPQAEALARVARELVQARGRALVVCGVDDVAVQTQVNRINERLGAYGATLDLARPSRQRQGSADGVRELAKELAAGAVDVLLVHGVNPAYDFPAPDGLGARLGKARLLVSLAGVPDETAALAHWVCPEPHFLERWDDAEPVQGFVALTQPALPRLLDTRTLRESLARWSGDARSDRELVRAALEAEVFPRSPEGGSFARWHRRALHDGGAELGEAATTAPAFRFAGVARPAAAAAPPAGAFALVLHPKVGTMDGRHAHNPWLQELADPVTRLAWEQEATLSPAAARALGVAEGDIVRLEVEGLDPAPELPVHVLPGLHDAVVGVPLGYGRLGTERFAAVGPEWWEGKRTLAAGERLGVNAAGWGAGGAVRLVRTGRQVELATVQDHRSLEVPAHLAPKHGRVRDAVQATTLAAFQADPHAAVERPHLAGPDLWAKDHRNDGPKWGLVVDLATCTGCSACVIACQAENNVPVVGRDEVRRHREMAWLRIDRYESGEGDAVRVDRQPMMCQHCAHAPCESVCPVLATVHSADGLNQQVYNRCVGTRYCANTCPYKARRFNWFDYPHEDELENHSLNPDVTVRTRGVMEKCSLCVQRIQEARLEARRLGRPVRDGEIRTACQQTCPTGAIVFGDLADPESGASRRAAGPRSYRVLEELNVAPAVRYLAGVRNPAT